MEETWSPKFALHFDKLKLQSLMSESSGISPDGLGRHARMFVGAEAHLESVWKGGSKSARKGYQAQGKGGR